MKLHGSQFFFDEKLAKSFMKRLTHWGISYSVDYVLNGDVAGSYIVVRW